MKYQVVLSHHNCQPPSFLMPPPALTHAWVLTHNRARLICFNWADISRARKRKETLSVHRLILLSVCAAVSDVRCACSRWLHINLRPQSEQHSKARRRAGIWFRPLALPSSFHPCGLPLYMTSEPLDSFAQLWPEQSRATPRIHPTFIHPQITMQATGIPAEWRHLYSHVWF